MGYLTTHVLDSAHGCPGSDIPVTLYRVDGERTLLAERHTNDDGRCDSPILDGSDFVAGVYELVFRVGTTIGVRACRYRSPHSWMR